MKNLPYAQQAGTLETMLDKMKTASIPEKFSQDFVSTKLSMKGGTAHSTIPFIKKMGFVSADGTPTTRYGEFRNSEKTGYAIAQSMREVYSTLFEMNEYAHELDNTKLRGLIVEATGAEASSTPVKKTLATFNSLKKMANFEAVNYKPEIELPDKPANFDNENQVPIQVGNSAQNNHSGEGINLSYTINLNLPTTTDIDVFNAIFKSLKQHLLQE